MKLCNRILLFNLVFLLSCGQKKTAEKYSLIDSTKNSVEQLTELIKLSPDEGDLFFYRGSLYFNTGYTNEALTDIQKAVELDSTKAEYFLKLGDIYFSKLFIAKAVTSFEKCLSINPQNIFAELKLAELFLYLRKYDNCLQHADNALRIDKTNPKAYFIKGFMFKEAGDTLHAVSSFQTATEIDTGYYDSFIQLGNLYSVIKNNLALQYYQKALRLRRNSPEALYGVAMFFQEDEKIDTAAALYEKILESAPDYKDALFNLGYINLIYKNDYAKAIEYFNSVNRNDSNDIRAIYNRGLCYEQMKRKSSAENDYHKALKLSPDYALAREGLKRLGKK